MKTVPAYGANRQAPLLGNRNELLSEILNINNHQNMYFMKKPIPDFIRQLTNAFALKTGQSKKILHPSDLSWISFESSIQKKQ